MGPSWSPTTDTIGWLRMQSARGLTRGQNRKIARVCQSLNVARVHRVTVIAQDCRRSAKLPELRRLRLISHIAFS